MPTMQQVRKYAQMRERIAEPARREFDRLARAVDLSKPDALEQLQLIAQAIMNTYGIAAAELGAQWFELCAETGISIELVTSMSRESLASNIGYNVQRVTNGLITSKTAFDYMANKAYESVLQSSEETIYSGMTQSVREGYASKKDVYIRVASPDACAFCQMVASNEWTFGDAQKAGFESHDGCRCVGVPYSGLNDVSGYSAAKYQERYYSANKTVTTQDYDEELKARIEAAKASHAAKTDKPWNATNETLVVMRYQNDLK